jgi:cytochrome c oxidase assembly factor CtaG
MSIGTFISGIVGGKASDIIDSVGNVADKFITTGQEKEEFRAEVQKEINRHIEAIQTAQNEELKTYLADMSNARDREIQIATSDKAPTINKIIQPILAILLLGSCFVMWYTILFKDIPEEKEMLVAGIVGSLTTIAMGVVSYYFGSSSSSAKKQDQLDKIMNK